MRYIIENDLLKAEISDLGATLTRFIDKRTGIDLVLGFDSDEEYIAHSDTNIGASIGRNANRIGNARFTLNGKEYQLTVNDNMNQLHGGGVNGFAYKVWDLVKASDDEVSLAYHAKDGEEGFPGELDTLITYRLDKDSLYFEFSGTADQDTLFNITNHSYFDLGDEDILDQQLHVTTGLYSPVDEYCLTLDEVRETKGTPFDFTAFTRIGDNLAGLENGIDNNYVWEQIGDKLMAELRNDRLQLNVYSDLPDMHIYTGNFLGGQKGKYGRTYGRYGAICLECQYYPNGINYGEKYLLPILHRGEKMSHYIRYEVKNREE